MTNSKLTGRTLLTVGVLAGGLVAAATVGLWYGASSPQAPPVTTVSSVWLPGTTEPVTMVTVHVSGAVVSPGLVSLAEGSRVAEAIAAAGGAQSGARLSGLNLAEEVKDGDHLIVPWLDESVGSIGGGASQPGPIDLNRADAVELTRLPGVGEVTAARIIAHRETNGPFRVIEDLLDVPGIGESKLAAIRENAKV